MQNMYNRTIRANIWGAFQFLSSASLNKSSNAHFSAELRNATLGNKLMTTRPEIDIYHHN